MQELTINPTPVRTSENYQINHMKINDLYGGELESFSNIIFHDFDDKKIKVLNETEPFQLTYGNGKEVEEQVRKNANLTLKLVMQQNSEKENRVELKLDEHNRHLVDLIDIVVEENCKGKVTIQYASDYNDSKALNDFYHNGIIRVMLKKNAFIKVNLMNLLSTQTQNFLSLENHLEENAQLQYNIVDFGGNSSVTNYYTNLLGDNSENELKTIYLGTGKQKIDMNYIVATKGKNTKVNMDVQGAIKDECQKHFKGTIDFKRGSKKAEGSENEFCMLLSDAAKSISLPMLLCDEEDVIGNHAAAAGKVNHKELFYLMSRGLSEQEAKILLVRARFHRVLDSIENEEVRTFVERQMNQKLG